MALDAGWDDELLSVEMQELQELGFDLGLTGFDESEIADLFDINSDEAKQDDFDVNAELMEFINGHVNRVSRWDGSKTFLYSTEILDIATKYKIK